MMGHYTDYFACSRGTGETVLPRVENVRLIPQCGLRHASHPARLANSLEFAQLRTLAL